MHLFPPSYVVSSICSWSPWPAWQPLEGCFPIYWYRRRWCKIDCCYQKSTAKVLQNSLPSQQSLSRIFFFLFSIFWKLRRKLFTFFSGATTARLMSHLNLKVLCKAPEKANAKCHWLWSLSSSASLISSGNFMLHHVEVFRISSRINS